MSLGRLRMDLMGTVPLQSPNNLRAHCTPSGYVWGRSHIAWEFLRRNPHYRNAVSRGPASLSGRQDDDLAATWGLRFLADPAKGALEAPVFWRPEAAPALVVELAPSHAAGAMGLEILGDLAEVRPAPEGLHYRLPSGLQALVHGGDPSLPHVAILPLSDCFPIQLRAAEALRRAIFGGDLAFDDLSHQQRTRLGRALVAIDGALARRTYREIAVDIFGADAIEREPWRGSTLKDVVIRLVRTGRGLVGGGYLKLLRPRRPGVGL